MTAIIVLPTADIVREFKPYDTLFEFYEDGIKGVVKDTLPLVEGWALGMYPNPHAGGEWPITYRHQVMDKVLREYQSSASAVVARMMENTSAELYVEMVVERIWRSVLIMMFNMFHHNVYEVSKSEGCWLGDDFVAWVRIFDRELNHHGRRF